MANPLKPTLSLLYSPPPLPLGEAASQPPRGGRAVGLSWGVLRGAKLLLVAETQRLEEGSVKVRSDRR